MGDSVQLKDEGNKFFQAGDIDKAIECYTKAIKGCKDKKVLAVIHRNRSACYLKKVNNVERKQTGTHTCTHIHTKWTHKTLLEVKSFFAIRLIFGDFFFMEPLFYFFLQESYTNAASDASKGRVNKLQSSHKLKTCSVNLSENNQCIILSSLQ